MSALRDIWAGPALAASIFATPLVAAAESAAKPLPVSFGEVADITLKGNGFSDLEMSSAARLAEERSNCKVSYSNDGVFVGGIEIIGKEIQDVAFDPTEAGLLAARLCRS